MDVCHHFENRLKDVNVCFQTKTRLKWKRCNVFDTYFTRFELLFLFPTEILFKVLESIFDTSLGINCPPSLITYVLPSS